jgi:hypothetical protein
MIDKHFIWDDSESFRIGIATITVRPLPYRLAQRNTHKVTIEFEMSMGKYQELSIAQELAEISEHIASVWNIRDYLIRGNEEEDDD